MATSDQLGDFASIKARLDEIVDAVSDDSLPLDKALDLYEEAVSLGLRISDVLEDGIVVDEAALEAQEQAQEQAQADGAQTQEQAQAVSTQPAVSNDALTSARKTGATD